MPFGKSQIKFTIPGVFNTTFLELKPNPLVVDIENKITAALDNPIKSRSLREIVKGKSSACIVVTDITRESPDKQLLPYILKILEQELNPEDVTILIACGMHRKMTHKEKVEKYGKGIADSYKIIDHDGKDQKNLVNLGSTKNGTPIEISKIALEADLLISLGVVEPHQFAGYSGGYKTVSIGVAGDKTIGHTHSPAMLKNPKTRVGNVKGNPIYDDIVEIGKKIDLDFIVNVVLGKTKEILYIAAGDPLKAHQYLIKKAKLLYEIPIKQKFDIAICGIGHPKDANLYQVSRAASYLFYAPSPVIKKGGYIIIPARCDEGAGKGTGENRFFSQLKDKSFREIIDARENFKAGEQRAFFMANVLSQNKVIIVGSSFPKEILQAKMIPAKNMDEAFEIVKNDLGSELDLLIIPNALLTLPVRLVSQS